MKTTQGVILIAIVITLLFASVANAGKLKINPKKITFD